MHPTRPSSQTDVALAEDGEAIGTVQQFSNDLNLPESRVLPCLQEHAGQSIILRAGDTSESLLILDTEGLDALLGCAAADSTEE